MAPFRIPSSIQSIGNLSQGFASNVPKSSTSTSDCLSRSSQSSSVKRYVKGSSSEKLHYSHVTSGSRLFFSCVPCSKENREISVSDRPLESQRVPIGGHIQDGHTQGRQRVAPTGHVGYVSGSQRRLPPHTHTPRLSEIPVLSSRKSQIPISGITVRTDVGSLGVYGSRQTDQKVDVSLQPSVIPIPRRLVTCPSGNIAMRIDNTGPPTAMSRIRPGGERREVGTSTVSVDNIPWRKSRPPNRTGVYYTIASSTHTVVSSCRNSTKRPPICQSGIITRPSSSDLSHCAAGSASSALSSTQSDSRYPSRQTKQFMDRHLPSSSTGSSMVDGRPDSHNRDSLQTSGSDPDGLYGRFHSGLGSGVRGSQLARSVAALRAAYQLVGDEDGSCSPPTSPIPIAKSHGTLSHRQLHDSSLPTTRRRNAITSIATSHVSRSIIGTHNEYPSDSSTYSRPSQCVSGSGISARSSSSVGMVVSRTHIPMGRHGVAVRSTNARHVRQQNQPQASSLHVSMPRPRGSGNRRSIQPVAKRGRVRISTDMPSASTVEATQEPEVVQMPTSSTVVSQRSMDAYTQLAPTTQTGATADHDQDVVATTLGVLPSVSTAPPATSVVSSGDHLRRLGFTERVINRIVSSRAASTNKQYKSKWDYFVY